MRPVFLCLFPVSCFLPSSTMSSQPAPPPTTVHTCSAPAIKHHLVTVCSSAQCSVSAPLCRRAPAAVSLLLSVCFDQAASQPACLCANPSPPAKRLAGSLFHTLHELIQLSQFVKRLHLSFLCRTETVVAVMMSRRSAHMLEATVDALRHGAPWGVSPPESSGHLDDTTVNRMETCYGFLPSC